MREQKGDANPVWIGVCGPAESRRACVTAEGADVQERIDRVR